MRSGFLFRLRQIALLTLVLGGFTTLIKASYVWEDWRRKRKPLRIVTIKLRSR